MRKFISSALLLCIAYTASTQNLQIEDTTNITSQRWRDTCFGLIDKSATQIPSGYLIDYSLGVIDKDFDGVSNNDTLKAYWDFFYYYNMLELSEVNNNGILQLTDDLFINAKRYKRDSSFIPLLFLFQSYQKINTNALSNNLFSITSDSVRLMDVSNRSSSPYDNKEIFIFTPIQTNIRQHGNISFSLPASFWQIPGINSISIDFNDGVGFRTISKGGTANVYYATEGYKTITAVISTANGNRTAKCRINYTRPEFYLQPDTSWSVSVEPVYTDEDDYLGTGRTSRTTSICDAGTVFDRVNCDINPGANVLVINGCDQVFDEPIIIVDGFDTDNSLTIDELFDRFNRFYGFIASLRSAGYDFVFVNFKNPLTYIENNAKVLEEVINQVNATKVGNARGSVIGFSMGGLVARWCLKDMEDRSIDHEMDHYFSYDAPHQGANIPLGLQYLFGEMARDLNWLTWNNPGGSPIQPDFQQLYLASRSGAAKQLLVTKSDYNNFPFNWDPTLNTLNDIRAEFAERLVQKGYPQNLTCHGIAFGRGNNTASTKNAGNGDQFGNFSPGSKLFDGGITYSVINLTASAFAVPENNTTDYICRYRFLGIKVVRIFNVNIAIASSFRVRNFQYTGQYAYDDAPGSYETTQTQFADRFNGFNGLAANATNLGHHGHNFVSTVSALDLLNQGYSSSTSWQSNNLFFNVDNSITNPAQVAGNTIVATLSPFNDVLTYTSDCVTINCQSINEGLADVHNNDWNQYHNGFISRQASQYIQRKILNAVPGTTCPGLCNNSNAISGQSSICTDRVYQLTGPNPAGLNIRWESVNGLFGIIGQGTTQITATIISNGNDIIRVTLTNGCGSTRVIEFPVVVGTPVVTSTGPLMIYNGPGDENDVCRYEGTTFDLSYTGSTSINWSAISHQGGSWPSWIQTATDDVYVEFFTAAQNTLILQMDASNTCGATSYQFGFHAIDCGARVSSKKYFKISPNPTNSSITISPVEQNVKSESKLITEVFVSDFIGNTLLRKKFDSVKSAQLFIGNLKAGIYNVKIICGTYFEAQTIQKN